MTGTQLLPRARRPRRGQGADLHRPHGRRARRPSASAWPRGSATTPARRRPGARPRDRRQEPPRRAGRQGACSNLAGTVPPRRGLRRRGAHDQRSLIGSPNQVEAVTAYFEKREPQLRGLSAVVPWLLSAERRCSDGSSGAHRRRLPPRRRRPRDRRTDGRRPPRHDAHRATTVVAVRRWHQRTRSPRLHRAGQPVSAGSRQNLVGFTQLSTTLLGDRSRASAVPCNHSPRVAEETMDQRPRPRGLYDPRFEHDACGVVVRRRHKGRAQPPDRRAGPRRRSATSTTAARPGAEVNTGDGAGILMQVPDRFLRAVVDFALPPAGALRRRHRLPARRRRAAPTRPRRPIEAIVADEGLTRARLARRAGRRPTTSAPSALAVDAGVPAAVRRRPGAAPPGIDLDRTRLLRPQAHRARGAGATASGSSTSRRCRAARSSTRACSPPPQLGAFFPDLARRAGRVGAGPGAQPLLDQHVPVVAAGPPVPLPRPQRRDQHRAGQPQLDAGPRGAARAATCSPATSSASSRSARRAPPTRPASTRCSSCCTSAAARCPTPC